MRMVAFRLHGYRRFERETTLDLTPRVVAVVGPNEAGKSGLLDAMEKLTNPDEVVQFVNAEFTGRMPPDGSKEILSALFELEPDDREALAAVPGAASIRLWQRIRDADGDAHCRVIPELNRDQTRRLTLLSGLERMIASTSKPVRAFVEAPVSEFAVNADEEQAIEPEEPVEDLTILELAERLMQDLRSDAETLAGGAQRRLEGFAAALEHLPNATPKYVRQLGEQCRELAAEHAEAHPNDRAFEILDARCPQVRVLRDTNRQLVTTYGFDEYEEPPEPLENLLTLAELDWAELKSAASEPGNPRLATMLGRGNRELEQRLHGSWNQARVSVELKEHAGALHVYPYDADSDEHSRIEDRSDGFKSFLALLAFTSRHAADDRKLVLGIDEAELHLHYNAQADLVKVLTRQTLVPQIIYTTHSAGCLPEDLGSGVRVVKTVPGDRSVIENGFWSARDQEGRSAGFTSLLMAMGAGAVGFTPARRAVITEGPSDAILLPALLRSAKGWDPDHPLELQPAGGLAWTPPRRLSTLEAEAAHVVYLTDSDETGREYRADLEKAGVEPARIFTLRAGSVTGLSVEDFVNKATYVAVVNLLLRELRDYQDETLQVSDVPNQAAANAAEEWMTARGINPISKTAIAEHVLRLSHASLAYIHWDPGEGDPLPLLRETRRQTLVRLYDKLREALKVDE